MNEQETFENLCLYKLKALLMNTRRFQQYLGLYNGFMAQAFLIRCANHTKYTAHYNWCAGVLVPFLQGLSSSKSSSKV